MNEIAQGFTADALPASPPDREQAFTALVDRHAPFLYRVAFGLLRNRQDAEDAVQETLLKLFRGEAWRAMDDEKAFLARAVWRAGLDRMGSASAKAMRNAEDVDQMELAGTAANPEQQAVDAAQRRLMRTLIEGLPENFRQPLVLSAIEGMTGHEVAAILGIPEATVRTRINRAKTELRERFLLSMNTPKGVRA